VEQAALTVSLQNLLTFPWVQERKQAGKLQLHAWWFDLERGQLWAKEDRDESFLQML
jgi:carbonic anhydrase